MSWCLLPLLKKVFDRHVVHAVHVQRYMFKCAYFCWTRLVCLCVPVFVFSVKWVSEMFFQQSSNWVHSFIHNRGVKAVLWCSSSQVSDMTHESENDIWNRFTTGLSQLFKTGLQLVSVSYSKQVYNWSQSVIQNRFTVGLSRLFKTGLQLVSVSYSKQVYSWSQSVIQNRFTVGLSQLFSHEGIMEATLLPQFMQLKRLLKAQSIAHWYLVNMCLHCVFDVVVVVIFPVLIVLSVRSVKS